jgi:hypothetical protein
MRNQKAGAVGDNQQSSSGGSGSRNGSGNSAPLPNVHDHDTLA